MNSLASDGSSVSVSAGELSNNGRHTYFHNASVTAKILDELNGKQAILHLPLISFLALLMLVGVNGNICVIYVYRTRFRKTAGSYFIMVLAVIDLATSSICISWEIYRLSSPYKNQSVLVCKVARFIQSFLYLSAALVLVCVAFSRYYKIVKPLQCYSSGQAQSLTIVTVAMGLCLVWPQLIISGMRNVHTGQGNVYAKQCDIANEIHDSVYTYLFHGIMYSVFVLCFALILVFYFRILCVVCTLGRGRLRGQVANRDYRPRSSSSNVSERSFGSSQNLSMPSRSQGGTRPVAENQRNCCSIFRRVGRTTRMLALVTFIFLLGYLPFLSVHLVNFLDLGFRRPLSYDRQMLYELCMRSYFLSCAANPLIYSILNARFRQESMVALKSILMQLPLWIQKRVKGHHGLERSAAR